MKGEAWFYSAACVIIFLGALEMIRFAALLGPLARYLAMNTVQNLKRYQISKVYRRDQPVSRYPQHNECYIY
jgi:hypothetical protein